MKKTLIKLISGLVALGIAGVALAAPAVEITQKQPLNVPAIVMFAIFVAMTLGITYWAASRTKSASDFYTAGGGITGFQNGLAIQLSARFNFLRLIS